MKKFLSIVLIIATAFFSLVGCRSQKEKYTDYSFDYFDTVTTVIGFEANKEAFDANCKKIKSWLAEYHKLYDIYKTYDGITNLCALNSAQGKEMTVDGKIIDLLLYSKDLNAKCQKLNVAMGSVLSIWHSYRDNGLKDPDKAELPDLVALKNAEKHTDFDKVIINKSANTVTITDPLLTLDVGAVAKGYAAQKVAEKMLKNGIEGYILNIGGNVKIVGNRPDDEAWAVGIENPDKESDEPYVEALTLSDNMSLVTSGSYQRFYTVNGKNYNHIIDPSTLYPAEYFSSVSVLCEDSALADGLSTSLFCMSYEDGKKLLESFDNVHALWITNDGQKLYSKGFKNYIKK